MKNKLIKTVLMLFVSLNSNAQNQHDNISGIFYGIGGSLVQSNLNDLNTSIAQNGFKKFKTISPATSYHLAFIANNVMLSYQGTMLQRQSTSNGGVTLKMNGSFSSVSLGFVTFTGKRSILCTSIGIGGRTLNLNNKTDSTKLDFKSQLNGPTGTCAIQTGGYICDLQLNYIWNFKKDRTSDFFLGFQAGYKFSISKSKALIYQDNLPNTPLISMNGFHASIIIGRCYFKRKK